MPLRAAASFDWGSTAGITTGNAGNRLFDIAATPTVTIVSTNPRTGTYCAQIEGGGFGWDTNTLGTSQNREVSAFGLYFPTSIPTTQILAQDSVAAGLNWIIWTDASDRLNGGFEGGNTQIGATLSPDTWYWIEVYVDYSANPSVFRWWIDGTEQTQVTQGQAATTITAVRLGSSNLETFSPAPRADDWVVLTDTAAITVPIGPHKVVMLKPDTGGTATQTTTNAVTRFTGNATADTTFNSADILAAISEVPPLIGSTATGVCQRLSGSTSAVLIPMTTYTLQSGETFQGNARFLGCGWAASTTANRIGMRCDNGTLTTTLYAEADPNFSASTTTPAWLCKVANEGDFSTQAEVDAMLFQIGYSTDISPLPGFHALYVDVPVKEAAGVSVNATEATGTGSAGTPQVTIASSITEATTTGTVDNATVSTGTLVGAQEATGVGTAETPQVTVATTITEATSTGDAEIPQVTIATTIIEAAAISDAETPQVTIATTIIEATSAGDAQDATVTTTGGTTVDAIEATSTGTAEDSTATVATTIIEATGGGVASTATVTIALSAQNALAVGEAAGAVSSFVSVDGQIADASGAAEDATASTSTATNVNAIEATGTGQAQNATVSEVSHLNVPDATLASTNLTGAFTDLWDDPLSPDGVFLTADDPAIGTDLRVSFPTPTTPPGSGGPTKFQVYVRKTTVEGAADPTVILELWESGSFIAELANTTVTSATGQVVEGTFNPASLSDASGAGVELRVRGVPV